MDEILLPDAEVLSRDQVRVLKQATPAELEFMISFVRKGAAGKTIIIWGYRLVVVLGSIATAIAAVTYLYQLIRGRA